MSGGEWTPTTDEVRFYFGTGWSEEHYAACWLDGCDEPFDRWLAAVKAEAWDEGFTAGEQDVLEHERTGDWDSDCAPNPYREVNGERA